MVETVIQYKCEICGELHNTIEDANVCEEIGKEEVQLELHQEVLLRRKMGGGWDDWWLPVRVGKIEDSGHYVSYQLEEELEDGTWERASYGDIYGNDNLNKDVKVK